MCSVKRLDWLASLAANKFPSHPLPRSYTKWLESAGARVVPIPFDLPAASLTTLLGQINGALFTGGSASFFNTDGSLTQYATTASAIYDEAVAAHAAGETWPLWGTCLGFELIGVLGAKLDRTVLTAGWDAENISLPVYWRSPAANTSTIWGGSGAVRDSFAPPSSLAMNAHTSAIAPKAFDANAALSSTFTALASSFDRGGNEFVAAMEGQNGLPIYATQWHPEKSLFEWFTPSDINHSREAIVGNAVPAVAFVEQARQNKRAFADPDEEAAALIYNYQPVYTGLTGSMFDQCYFFAAQ